MIKLKDSAGKVVKMSKTHLYNMSIKDLVKAQILRINSVYDKTCGLFRNQKTQTEPLPSHKERFENNTMVLKEFIAQNLSKFDSYMYYCFFNWQVYFGHLMNNYIVLFTDGGWCLRHGLNVRQILTSYKGLRGVYRVIPQPKANVYLTKKTVISAKGVL